MTVLVWPPTDAGTVRIWRPDPAGVGSAGIAQFGRPRIRRWAPSRRSATGGSRMGRIIQTEVHALPSHRRLGMAPRRFARVKALWLTADRVTAATRIMLVGLSGPDVASIPWTLPAMLVAREFGAFWSAA